MADARPFHWEYLAPPIQREAFRIAGGRPLSGVVPVSGAKNAALKLLAAATLTGERCRFTNVPEIADVAVLCEVLADLGIVVDPIYCTRTVSKLVRTYTDRHGLKDNLLELLDVEMDKAARHTDWSNPGLTPEQIRYAISDVTLLLPLKDRLEEMLQREGRKELAEQCFKVIPVMALLDLLGYEDLFEH